MKLIWAFIKALPELLALVKMIEAKCEELKVESDVKKNVEAVHAAFEKKDANELRKIFNS